MPEEDVRRRQQRAQQSCQEPEGYELKTKLLSPDRLEETLSFTADKRGMFDLTCDWRCEGHKNLKGGVVMVQ